MVDDNRSGSSDRSGDPSEAPHSILGSQRVSKGGRRSVTESDTDDPPEGPPWFVKYTVWEKTDDARGGREYDTHTGEQKVWTGHYGEETPLDCVNAIVYELRGCKSKWELAYVDEIRPAGATEEDDG